MKRITWKKLAQDKTLLSIILAGTIVLTAITAGIVMRGGSDAPDSTDPYLELNESEKDVADKEPDTTEKDASMADSMADYDNETATHGQVRPAGADHESVDASIEEPGDQSQQPEESEPSTTAVVLSFGESGQLTWPIAGSIIREYSMDHTIYHATLEQYKVSPGILIQGEPGEMVVAPAIGQVTETGYNEEIGNYVVLYLGNGYEAVIGQLDAVSVAQSQYVTAGTPLGVVAQPTKYSTVEGPNVYFRLNKDGAAVDPVDFLE